MQQGRIQSNKCWTETKQSTSSVLKELSGKLERRERWRTSEGWEWEVKCEKKGTGRGGNAETNLDKY